MSGVFGLYSRDKVCEHREPRAARGFVSVAVYKVLGNETAPPTHALKPYNSWSPGVWAVDQELGPHPHATHGTMHRHRTAQCPVDSCG